MTLPVALRDALSMRWPLGWFNLDSPRQAFMKLMPILSGSLLSASEDWCCSDNCGIHSFCVCVCNFLKVG